MAAVLIVEDDPDLRDLYEEFLSDQGHEPCAVATAEQAVAALDARPFALVLLDRGIEGGVLPVAEALRRTGGRTALLLVSGARDIAEQARALGASHWLEKPFRMEKLKEAVAACLS